MFYKAEYRMKNACQVSKSVLFVHLLSTLLRWLQDIHASIESF